MKDQTESVEPHDPGPPQRWIAYELHDGLLQWVVGARMQVEAALNESVQNLPTATATRQLDWHSTLQTALTYLDSAVEEGRALIDFLERDALQENATFEATFIEFVDALTPDLERNAQSVSLELEQMPELTDVVRWNLLRIVQQALRNAIQHAGPTPIRVRADLRSDGSLRLSVQDRGVGFDPGPAARRPYHFGLASMELRAKLIKAKLQFASQPGSGCVVTCTLPSISPPASP